jgi:RNA polymerase sigma-70 factor, ECF subfamily
MTTSDFETCLVAAKQGDESAFTVLFRALQPRLLRYLRTVGGDLADDVAAETWLSVVRGLARFAGDEPGWQAWVFTIARARLVDAQRKAARLPIPVDSELHLGDRAGPIDVGACVEEMFSTEAALALIGCLPDEQAEIVLLRHVVGLDVAHTARVVGKRQGAVRVADHRALRRLAETLAQRQTPAGGDAVTPGTRRSVSR